MKRILRRLMSVLIASFYMLSVLAQENKSTAKAVERMNFSQKNEIELRTVTETEWWPDSVITFNYIGAPTIKDYYDKASRTNNWSYLENGSWIHNGPISSNGYNLWQPHASVHVRDDGSFFFRSRHIWTSGSSSYDNRYIPNAVYDKNSNLILLEITMTIKTTGWFWAE